ncbi:MAG: S-methyl-5-thioribose-1-phosphate isomerase [Planctomycetota bacterium]|jgi:methylthioribose-1-phosphate isomerase
MSTSLPPLPFETAAWVGELPGHCRLIEQTLLPERTEYLDVHDVPAMVDAIYRLAVRGAPAIGVAAAYGVVLGVQNEGERSVESLREHVGQVCDTLAAARPTAVNLFWALDRMRRRADELSVDAGSAQAVIDGLFIEARAIHTEDADQCRRMGELGAELINDGMTLLTHCNAGALATGGMGTALAPMYVAHAQGKRISVFADETRPLLQGARLTSWELHQAGIPVTVITDNMSGSVMNEGKVDAIFVGSDRIARNGDVCNKIGTYMVAVLAARHGVPFYVVAPTTTFDAETASGDLIPIEERKPEEITNGFGKQTVPDGVAVYNPAFDVTPHELVTAIITEAGVIERPDTAKVEALLRKAGALASA